MSSALLGGDGGEAIGESTGVERNSKGRVARYMVVGGRV